LLSRFIGTVSGLFVPLHFRSPEREVHRENFHSVEHSLPGSEKKTFVPWNFCTLGTFAAQERMFQELSLHGSFAPVEQKAHRSDCQQLSFPWKFRSCVTHRSVLPYSHPIHYCKSCMRLSCEATLISDNDTFM